MRNPSLYTLRQWVTHDWASILVSVRGVLVSTDFSHGASLHPAFIHLDLAQEKGATSWFTSLPLKEFNLTLHKAAFRDVVALRYGWQPPTPCSCGSSFAVEHALSCPKGGFPIMRHNEVRDLTANLMAEVCHDVCIEPTLQPVTGELLSGASAITDDGARLDIAASGFWGGHYECAFFDVRIFNPHVPSNHQPISTCYIKHENSEKRSYEQHVREI